MKDTKQLLMDVLLKKAKGYSYREKTDEYNVVDGTKRLVKSKVVTKRVQPDVNAIKALITLTDASDDVSQMTDEQLQVEKLRLLNLLNSYQNSSPPSPTSESDDDGEI